MEFLDDGSLAVPFDPTAPPEHGRFDGRVVARVPRADTWVGGSAFDERDVANELRRGWEPFEPSDEYRASLPIPDRSIHFLLRRASPGDPSSALVLAHAGHRRDESWIEGVEVVYLLETDGRSEFLEDVRWADWDARARLLVATLGGEIQIREPDAGSWRHDVVPRPQRARARPARGAGVGAVVVSVRPR